MDRLKWAFRLMRSKTYVVLTDKSSVVNIPITSLDSFENTLLLAAQTASLQEFASRLEDLISEHEQAIELIARRQGEKPKASSKAKTTGNKSGSKVRKTAKKRSS